MIKGLLKDKFTSSKQIDTEGMDRKEPKTVIFLHIPKTGGRTLHWIINKLHDPSHIFQTSKVNKAELSAKGILPRRVPAIEKWDIAKRELCGLNSDEKKRIKILMGHMLFGWHEFLPQPCTYVTFLRNPYDQIVSYYYYLLGREGHYLRDHISAGQMDIAAFLESGIDLMVDNPQTRLISGAGFDVGFGQCNNEMLAVAKDNLVRFFSVAGLTENFDTSLVLLRRSLDWSMPFYIKQNVNKERIPRSSVPLKDLKAIKEYSAFDIELYDFARSLFEEKVQEQGASLYSEVKLFRFWNTIYGRIMAPLYSINKAGFHKGRKIINLLRNNI